MVSVIDVAAYVLDLTGEVTAMKLQKLVYYSQAWSLVWDEEELFPDVLQAWANGPVAPALYQQHRGMFRVSRLGGSGDRLSAAQKDTIRRVVEFYGSRSAQWLSDLSHLEFPWRCARARAKVASGEVCDEIITTAEMHEYYSSLMPGDEQETLTKRSTHRA